MNSSVIIVAAGKGKRFKGKIPKQYVKIKNETILNLTVKKFINFSIKFIISVSLFPVKTIFLKWELMQRMLITKHNGYEKYRVTINLVTEQLWKTCIEMSWVCFFHTLVCCYFLAFFHSWICAASHRCRCQFILFSGGHPLPTLGRILPKTLV